MKPFPNKSCIAGLALLALVGVTPTLHSQAFVHPGCLETEADFARMNTKIAAGQSPWIDSYIILTNNSHAQSTYVANPVAILVRGTGNSACSTENYSRAYNDAAAAYQLALRWKISGNTAFANAAVNVLNAWSSTCTNICGDSNSELAAGLYGYEFACAAEIMRSYSGWSSPDFARFKGMMTNVFYTVNEHYITTHNGTCISHYWANWDLCNLASIMAIGVLCDDRAKYNEALNYWKSGPGNGAISNAVPFTYNNGTLGQGQEEGRDQGHAGLNVSLQGVICQIAFNQGDDLFGMLNNRILAMCEYFADYNLSNSVPYTTYNNCDNVNQTVISSASRGDIRPAWDLIYNYYANRLLVSTPFSQQYAAKVRPEGGGGNYGSTSGGFDQLGFTTLTCTIDKTPIANGKYYIVNRADGKYLDNLGVATNGAAVAQWQSSASNNQKWNVTYYGGGYYRISCVTGGLYIDDIGHTADGSTVNQWGSSSSWNQQWMIVPVGSYYKLIARNSGKCLDTGGQTANGSVMQQWYSNTSNNQQWSFVTAP